MTAARSVGWRNFMPKPCWPAALNSTWCLARHTRAYPWPPPGPWSWRGRGATSHLLTIARRSRTMAKAARLGGSPGRESMAIIRAAGARPEAIAKALDRQEKATEDGCDADYSAVQYVRRQLGLGVCAIAWLADLLQYLTDNESEGMRLHRDEVLAYRQRYGVNEG